MEIKFQNKIRKALEELYKASLSEKMKKRIREKKEAKNETKIN